MSASPVTDIHISFSPSPPSESFSRFGKTRTPCFFWLSRSAGIEPVTSARVLYDDETVPDGFTRLPEDLNKGEVSQRRIFLAFSRIKSLGFPILDLKVVEGEEASGEGFVRIERDLSCRDANLPLFLCFKSQQG